MAAGYLSPYPLARGVSNLTGAGLTLADNIMGFFLDASAGHWEVDSVAHPPVFTDPLPHRFAAAMSEGFDFYSADDSSGLWFDCNLAHLDWLRAQPLPGRDAVRAVASHNGIYRPVQDVRNLVRDEFIHPFTGMHLLMCEERVARTWTEITEVLAALADAVGIPLLLADRTPPEHYARRCVAALLPAPGGQLEPWMLAYELGDAFHDYVDLPGSRILEIGISGRIIAFAAALSAGRAAAFGSAVVPCQALIADAATTEDRTARDAGLRTAPAGGSSTLTGLAPVVVHRGQSRYSALLEDYARVHDADAPLSELLRREDAALRAAGAAALSARVTERYDLVADTGDRTRDDGKILAAPDDAWPGTLLRRRG
ncbi:hypothetical protein [Streptomyces sp. IBSBF 2435]|uniref:hypothetical protein n=1 Tax=Streptomyces sp. IBSBF 2435 TaxID=2903531 RepID=UPI002FDC148F